MKVAIISDLHGFLPELPDVVDVLIIAGDICPVVDHGLDRQSLWLSTEFKEWLERQPAHFKVGVAGNHDFALEKFRFDLPWTYLDNSSTQYGGLAMWGTPLSGRFGKWAFMRDEEDLNRTFVDIDPYADIVIAHGPPKGYGDECQNGYHAGSPSLTTRIREIKPALTVTGHIHEARGIYATGWSTIVNASAVDLSYALRPDPFTYVYI
jgi:Icc-related predicted phosphoesterase